MGTPSFPTYMGFLPVYTSFFPTCAGLLPAYAGCLLMCVWPPLAGLPRKRQHGIAQLVGDAAAYIVGPFHLHCHVGSYKANPVSTESIHVEQI